MQNSHQSQTPPEAHEDRVVEAALIAFLIFCGVLGALLRDAAAAGGGFAAALYLMFELRRGSRTPPTR